MYGSWKPTVSSRHLIKSISTFPLGVFTFSTSLSILVTLYLSLLLKSCLEIKDFSSQLEEMKMVVSKNKAYTMRKRQRGGVNAAASLGIGFSETMLLNLPNAVILDIVPHVVVTRTIKLYHCYLITVVLLLL